MLGRLFELLSDWGKSLYDRGVLRSETLRARKTPAETRLTGVSVRRLLKTRVRRLLQTRASVEDQRGSLALGGYWQAERLLLDCLANGSATKAASADLGVFITALGVGDLH